MNLKILLLRTRIHRSLFEKCSKTVYPFGILLIVDRRYIQRNIKSFDTSSFIFFPNFFPATYYTPLNVLHSNILEHYCFSIAFVYNHIVTSRVCNQPTVNRYAGS